MTAPGVQEHAGILKRSATDHYMKQVQSRRRGRGKAGSKKGGNSGSGPSLGNRAESRVRGNAKQQLEKYKSLARDAHQSGDPVMAEYYHQHMDHFQRLLNEQSEARGPQQQGRPDKGAPRGPQDGANGAKRRRGGHGGPAAQDTRGDGASEASVEAAEPENDGASKPQAEAASEIPPETLAKDEAAGEKAKPKRKPRVAKAEKDAAASDASDAGAEQPLA